MEKRDANNFSDLAQLGDKIQDIIENAVSSQNYQKMNQTITQAVNKTIRQYQAAQDRNRASVQPARSARPPVYAQLGGDRVKSTLQLVFGGVLTGVMGIGLLAVLLLRLFVGGGAAAALFLLVFLCVGIGLLAGGCRGLGQLGRFKKYMQVLGNHTYSNFDQLSKAVGRPVNFVIKDVKAMIRKGWFLEGHVDRQETCLITSNETYRQYEAAEKQQEQKKAEEADKAAARGKVSREVQEVLDRGDAYLKKIRESNEAIPGEEISAKITRIEQVVGHIFQRAQEHPEIVPDLKRLMDYYLPMTVKLLNAYADMDRQPVQGENIRNSKKEIEDTLDTLNEAFEKLLDSVFQDTAWDVSSDIAVLHTILAQEGLTGNDFVKK